jgi:uncharacterized protein YbdZ (MbtH family)
MRQMKKQFSVTYETKGMKVFSLWLPEGVDLPADWETMSLSQKDEWLYENQDESHLIWTDEHEGVAVNILPMAQLKAVV